MSNYTPVPNELGVQPIAQTSTTQNHPLGFKVGGYDSTLGYGEFIYLAGVGSTAVGTLVTYNQLTGATTLAPNTAHLAQPVAVAMAANTATTSFGWYQVFGAAVIAKTAVKVNPAVQLYLSGTAGSVMPTQASGKQLLGVISLNAATVLSATGTITAQISYPFAQGQIL
jgi:hypothetical protein